MTTQVCGVTAQTCGTIAQTCGMTAQTCGIAAQICGITPQTCAAILQNKKTNYHLGCAVSDSLLFRNWLIPNIIILTAIAPRSHLLRS
jgi:hypothetical protein